MSQELGLDVVGFKSREVYEMIAKMNIVHPVTQWASDGAAMKLPSPSSQVTLASNSTYSVRLTPQG
jgi:hypothetical protein